VDIAGASSLIALQFACSQIRERSSQELACCAGVHMCITGLQWPLHSAVGLLCPAGRCLTLDSSANGYIRGEGVSGIVIRSLEVDDDADNVRHDDEHMLGVFSGWSSVWSGGDATVHAPASCDVQRHVLFDACRASTITPSDVDGVEIHGEGHLLADAVEFAAANAALRAQDPDENLHLSSMKSNCGNGIENAGLSSIMKVLWSLRWAIVPGSQHLSTTNPHLEIDENPLVLATELAEYRMKNTFVGVTACSDSGAVAHVHCYGFVDEELRPPPQPQLERSGISFWPSGGGSLGDGMSAEKGYFVVGTFNNWCGTEPMENEGDGVYGYTLTLGENRWERFQIRVDYEEGRMLHPSSAYGVCGSQVCGPEWPELGRYSAWLVDGRGNEQDPLEFPDRSIAYPGDRFRVYLHIAGKWRTVTWLKLDQEKGKDVTVNPPPTGEYYVAGSWADWKLDKMTPHDSDPGVYNLEVTLDEAGGHFQLVRNQDWTQTICPVSPGASAMVPICGPSDRSANAWYICGNAGDVFQIEFRRTVDGPDDKMSICWGRAPAALVGESLAAS